MMCLCLLVESCYVWRFLKCYMWLSCLGVWSRLCCGSVILVEHDGFIIIIHLCFGLVFDCVCEDYLQTNKCINACWFYEGECLWMLVIMDNSKSIFLWTTMCVIDVLMLARSFCFKWNGLRYDYLAEFLDVIMLDSIVLVCWIYYYFWELLPD